MSDVIHATMQAIAAVMWRGPNGPHGTGDDETIPQDVRACSWEPTRDQRDVDFAMRDVFTRADGLKLVKGERPLVRPTCQACRVLLDLALEHPVTP